MTTIPNELPRYNEPPLKAKRPPRCPPYIEPDSVELEARTSSLPEPFTL